MFKKIIIFITSLLLIINSTLSNAATIGAWTVSNPMAVGASILYDGSKGAVTSSVLITPNASQVAKVLRGGLAGYALTLAVEQLLGAVDWVLDPANNQVKYKVSGEDRFRVNSRVGVAFNNVLDACNYAAANFQHSKWKFYYYEPNGNVQWLCKGKELKADGTEYFPTYDPATYALIDDYRIINEKSLPLETVAQKVIENAESDNLDAQFAVLAAANNILSEAENDDAKAKPIEDELERNAKNPPCITVSGKVVAVGTYGYRHDIVPPSKPHYPFTGDHYNLYRANQNPNNGKCFWVESGAADASNGQLPPPNSIPIEPFI